MDGLAVNSAEATRACVNPQIMPAKTMRVRFAAGSSNRMMLMTHVGSCRIMWRVYNEGP